MSNIRRKLVRENPKFNVKKWRQKMGLLQGEAAILLHTTARVLRRWEREGVSPRDIHIKEMQRLEREKYTGISVQASEERAKVTREMPPQTSHREAPEFIGIAPSSW